MEHEIASGELERARMWRRFISNTGGVFGLIYMMILVIIAILGYMITPDKTTNGNNMILQLANEPPGTTVTLLLIRKNQDIEDPKWWELLLFGAPDKYNEVPIVDYRIEEDKIIVVPYEGDDNPLNVEEEVYNIADVVYPLSPEFPEVFKRGDILQFVLVDYTPMTVPISLLQQKVVNEHIVERTFWLGTDRMGRDILTRLMLGTRISLSVGFVAVLVALLIGVTLGMVSGYFGGKVDSIIMWLINVAWSIPTLLLVFALMIFLGKGLLQIFLAVGLTMWVDIARVVRGQVIQIREMPYIEAAKVLGIKSSKILWRHILPNLIGTIMVISASNFAAAIIIEAGLSFLGLGVQPPVPSWGTMIREHYGYIMSYNPYLAMVPGIAIMFTVLAFYQIGNALRDAFDVKLVS